MSVTFSCAPSPHVDRAVAVPRVLGSGHDRIGQERRARQADGLQRLERHDDAGARVAIDARRLDVDGAAGQRGANLRGRQRRIRGLEQRRDRGGVRRGRRCAEERDREPADAGHRHAVGGCDIRLLQHHAAGRREVARRDRPCRCRLKKIRRGPSELNVSTTLAALNGFGNDRGRVDGRDAERSRRAVVAAWPWVSPAVAIDNRPRLVVRCRKRRGAPCFLTITMRSPGAAPVPISCSNGSCVPFWMLVEPASTAVPALFRRNRS